MSSTEKMLARALRAVFRVHYVGGHPSSASTGSRRAQTRFVSCARSTSSSCTAPPRSDLGVCAGARVDTEPDDPNERRGSRPARARQKASNRPPVHLLNSAYSSYCNDKRSARRRAQKSSPCRLLEVTPFVDRVLSHSSSPSTYARCRRTRGRVASESLRRSSMRGACVDDDRQTAVCCRGRLVDGCPASAPSRVVLVSGSTPSPVQVAVAVSAPLRARIAKASWTNAPLHAGFPAIAPSWRCFSPPWPVTRTSRRRRAPRRRSSVGGDLLGRSNARRR